MVDKLSSNVEKLCFTSMMNSSGAENKINLYSECLDVFRLCSNVWKIMFSKNFTFILSLYLFLFR